MWPSFMDDRFDSQSADADDGQNDECQLYECLFVCVARRLDITGSSCTDTCQQLCSLPAEPLGCNALCISRLLHRP